MSQNDALATAAHLHVLLRRKTGRVTDTEWMASNVEYAQAMVGWAREKAASDGHAELLPLADRLEALVIQPHLRKIALAQERATVVSPLLSSSSPPANELHTRYIGRLR